MSQTNETPHLTAVKTDTTSSLSGKSEITYTLGSDQNNALSIQLIGNTGAGHFSTEWIAYSAIQEALPESSFTSVVLRPLFQNRSLNSSGFLLAALLNEGLVVRVLGERLKFVRALNTENPKDSSTSSVKTSAKKSRLIRRTRHPTTQFRRFRHLKLHPNLPEKKISRAKSVTA